MFPTKEEGWKHRSVRPTSPKQKHMAEFQLAREQFKAGTKKKINLCEEKAWIRQGQSRGPNLEYEQFSGSWKIK